MITVFMPHSLRCIIDHWVSLSGSAYKFPFVETLRSTNSATGFILHCSLASSLLWSHLTSSKHDERGYMLFTFPLHCCYRNFEDLPSSDTRHEHMHQVYDSDRSAPCSWLSHDCYIAFPINQQGQHLQCCFRSSILSLYLPLSTLSP